MVNSDENSSIFEVTKDGIEISTDKTRLDRSAVHDYLSNRTLWAKGRSLSLVDLSIENSLCFGVYKNSEQIGFSRVVTDYSVFAFVLDVYVIDQYQGLGIGKFLMTTTMSHPEMKSISLWSLITKDAHGLYKKYGFTEIENPMLWMQLDNRV